MKRRLLCILSDQQIPNVLAAIHFKPDVVHMVIAEDFAAWDEKLKCFLDATRSGGFEAVSVEPLHVSRQDDVAATTAEVCRVLDQCRGSEWQVLFNGGTKPLAGAVQAAVQAREDVLLLYMNTDDASQFSDLRNPEQVIQIAVRLNVQTFLLACGFTVVSTKQFVGTLIASTCELAATGQGHFWSAGSHVGDLRHTGQHALPFDATTNADILSAIQQSGESTENFLKGDWLEYLAYSWLITYCTSGLVDDLCRGVKFGVAQDRSETASHFARENELDVVFTARNKLYWIECKTSKRERADNDDDLLLDFYKAVAVTYGLHATGVRAAFMHSNARLTSANIRERAERFNIALFGKSAVQNIGKALMNGERHPLKSQFVQWLSTP